MSTITWLHLSDLHFRKSQAYEANIVLKALLRDLVEQQVRPDFIAVSGDVAFAGRPAEYELAWRFFDDLLSATGLGKDRMFLAPGNHDVDRSLISTGARAIGDSLTDRKSANALLSTAADRKLVFARFKGYAAFVKAYLGKERRFDDSRYFYVHHLDLAGQRVALLGLNSAWLCASDEDKANGLLIGERQARAALEQATGASLKIALLHHPFDWLREFDQSDSAAMLTDGCDFILHGHLHQAATTQLTSPDGAATILACGACYETREFPNMYNWVRLDLAAGTGTVHLRRYSDARGGFWARDTLTYKNAPDGAYTFSLPGRGAASPDNLPSKPDKEAKAGEPPEAHERITITGGVVGAIGGRDHHVEQTVIYAAAPISPPPGPAGFDLGAMRRRLNQVFDDASLDAFCLEHFPDLYDRFGRGMGKDEKITLLLDHCRRLPACLQRLAAALGEQAG